MHKTKNTRVAAVALATAVMLSAAVTSAQEVTPSLASQDTSVPGGTLLMICYIVLWVMIGGYIFFVMRRQKALEKDLGRLEGRLDEVLGTGAEGEP
ncbi:CcmD family protein [Lujinxingia litoralis]|nr:CcmD family protein [Lujinxingia litoralis]